jgi:NADP-dependent aldehyde dehydrogenase
MKQWAEKIAQGFSASVTLGVGQFCTNPGLLIYENAHSAKEFTKHLEEEFKKTSGGAMLAENIYESYKKGIAHHTTVKGIELFANGTKGVDSNIAQPVLFKTNSEIFSANPDLAEEIFGPASVVVETNSKEEILTIAKNLSGHLTATIHGTETDLRSYKNLLDILEQKVGRILINGFPTGVEVCHSMVHGGPFPATTDSRSTSVGSASIYRFTRPVCYQAMPDELLPHELKDGNPLNIWRLVNGEFTRK